MTAPTGAGASDSMASSSGEMETFTVTTDDHVPVLDVGDGMGTADPDDKPGCDKVDFLFVIDNSGSMADEQQNLIASFPKFIAAIEATLDEAQDYHVMVIDTDPWVWANCETFCGVAGPCLDEMGVCDPGIAFQCPIACLALGPCTGYMCGGNTEPFECEDVLGAGVTHPRGSAASGMDCEFASGARYMTSNEPDLTGTFACAAQVGTGSTTDPERPMEAMVQAVTPGTDAWSCNEGFLRDDAILVVTFITDEDDNPGDGSEGTVEGWRNALIAAKNGDPNAVVVLGLFGDQDQPDSICTALNDGGSGAEPSPRLRQFVDSWGNRGFAGSVCAPSYEDFFLEAVGIIDTTCNEFEPPVG